MRVLSIRQPWASLLVLGVKRWETRSWHTSHRGPLAIHAARKISPTTRTLCDQEPMRTLLERAGLILDQLPRGVVLGTAYLVDCVVVDELADIPESEHPL